MKLLIPPPIQAAICVGAMFLVARYVPALNFSFSFQSVLAGLFVGTGILIDLASLRMFYKSETTVSPISPNKTSSLVTTGIYRFTRNPMYLGLVIILTGVALWFGNFGGFIFVLVFIWFITRFQIVPEEEALLEKFGVDYADYCMTTRRWI